MIVMTLRNAQMILKVMSTQLPRAKGCECSNAVKYQGSFLEALTSIVSASMRNTFNRRAVRGFSPRMNTCHAQIALLRQIGTSVLAPHHPGDSPNQYGLMITIEVFDVCEGHDFAIPF